MTHRKETDRIVPKAEGDYRAQVEKLSLGGKVGPGDAMLIKALKKEFLETGIIERAPSRREKQSTEELNEIITEARLAAKTERELNPEYYAEGLEESLGGDLPEEQDWENPSLYDIDDYEDGVYYRNNEH